MAKRGWTKRKPTKAEKAALKRLEREEEIYAKAPEELTESEWKWLRDVMNKIHHEDPRGRKKKTWCDDWMHKIARARLRGEKPPLLRDLAGLIPQTTAATTKNTPQPDTRTILSRFEML